MKKTLEQVMGLRVHNCSKLDFQSLSHHTKRKSDFMWGNGSLLPYPQLLSFLSFCCCNLAKHQILEESSSFTSSILQRPAVVRAARITVALPDSCASQSRLHSVFHCRQNDLSVMNLIVSGFSLKILYGLFIVFRIKIQIPQCGKPLLVLATWPLLTNLLPNLFYFFHIFSVLQTY